MTTADLVFEFAEQSVTSFERATRAPKWGPLSEGEWALLVRHFTHLDGLLNDLWSIALKNLQLGGEAGRLGAEVDRVRAATTHLLTAMQSLVESAEKVERDGHPPVAGVSDAYRVLVNCRNRIAQGEAILGSLNVPRKPMAPEEVAERAAIREAVLRGDHQGEDVGSILARLNSGGSL